MKTSRRAGLVVIALVVPFSLAACGGDGDDDATDPETVATVTVTPGADSTESATPTTPTTTTSPTESAPPTTDSMTIEPTGVIDEAELMEDIEGAVTIADDWWKRHWKDFFTGRYTAPNVVGIYDGNDEANAPTCFGDPLPPGNAFYCPDGDYVAWDKTLLELGYEIGDAWPYLIIAHEWGHAIQADLSMNLQSEKYELQADCLAGAVLYGQREDRKLKFEDGDEKEIVDGLNFIADEVPWGMSGDHGDSFERIEAFNLGRTAGVPGCLPGQTG